MKPTGDFQAAPPPPPPPTFEEIAKLAKELETARNAVEATRQHRDEAALEYDRAERRLSDIRAAFKKAADRLINE